MALMVRMADKSGLRYEVPLSFYKMFLIPNKLLVWQCDHHTGLYCATIFANLPTTPGRS